MQILKTRLFVLVAVVLIVGFVAGRACAPVEQSSTTNPDEAVKSEPTIWTCSMHPQVRLPGEGQCPICFMDLIPATSGDEEDLGPRTLQLTETAAALAEIETAPVERRSVAHEVGMIGKIALDETRLAYITSRVAGRLDRLYVDYTGVTVRANDHLVEIYSPTLYTAQQELLQAIETVRRLDGASIDVLRTTSNRTVISAREKLRLYGLGDNQIEEIVERGTPREHITIYAPIGGVVIHKNAVEGMYVGGGTQIYTIADLTKVWVLFDAYESDLAWLRYGQEVEFRVEAYPGETFEGRIAFIDPLLDDSTRTVKIRLNVDNTDGRLKPDMFVSGVAHAVLTKHGKVVDEDLAGQWMCPMHPEIVASEEEACPECGMDLVLASELGFTAQPEVGDSLVIPKTAPLITGKRAVVYVRVPDQEKPTFEGRVVELGPRAGDWYIVRGGLQEGESVVVRGNFKLDSELQIRAKFSMMNPDPDEQEPVLTLEVPEDFRMQLGAVLEPYVSLQTSFANDEDQLGAAKSIDQALSGVSADSLKGAARTAWGEQLPVLQKAARDVAEASDLESRRVLLSPLTESLILALKTFGYAREAGDVGIFHCPMALDGDGANWLQVGETTANPYYGSAMLRCGSQTEALSQENSKLDDEPQIDEKQSVMNPDPEGPVPSLAVTDEFRAKLGSAVEAYLRMQESFSNDEDYMWDLRYGNPPVFWLDVEMLSGEARAAWEAQRPELHEASENLGKAGDFESRRALLSPLSDLLIRALKTFGYTREGGDLRVFHCPMALDGEGANWIQVSETCANPYYGSMMLRCGKQTEVLQQGN